MIGETKPLKKVYRNKRTEPTSRVSPKVPLKKETTKSKTEYVERGGKGTRGGKNEVPENRETTAREEFAQPTHRDLQGIAERKRAPKQEHNGKKGGDCARQRELQKRTWTTPRKNEDNNKNYNETEMGEKGTEYSSK